ncbi:MAG: TrkA family potassium uptake protein, partial [Cyanobacteria bacterium J149]
NIFGMQFISEPVLICMVAGFYVANFSRYRHDLSVFIERYGVVIFFFFFTMAGLELRVDLLPKMLGGVSILVLVKFIIMFLASFFSRRLGGLSEDKFKFLWLSFFAQAGIPLGLAREAARVFPLWGGDFYSFFIVVIIVNTLLGVPLLKLAILGAREAHIQKGRRFKEGHRVVIFGVENISIALAKKLSGFGWDVYLVDRSGISSGFDFKVQFVKVSEFSKDEFKRRGFDKASAFVCFLDDYTNLEICSFAKEYFKIDTVIVRSQGKVNVNNFFNMGVLVVESSSALVNLIAAAVRSPMTAQLVIEGGREEADMLEVELLSRELDGIYVRDLRLPSDVLIVAIRRGTQLLLPHGYNRLLYGDEVTFIGKRKSLEEVRILFEEG